MLRRNFLKFGILPVLGLTGCKISGSIGLEDPDSVHTPTKCVYYHKIDDRYSWKISRDLRYKKNVKISYNHPYFNNPHHVVVDIQDDRKQRVSDHILVKHNHDSCFTDFRQGKTLKDLLKASLKKFIRPKYGLEITIVESSNGIRV